MVWPFGRSEALDAQPLTPADAAMVAGLHAEGGFARCWTVAECAALLAERAVVADGLRGAESGRLAAFVMARQAAGEAEILSLVVARARRGGGLGGSLIAAHRAALIRRGVTALFLEVADGNAPALALYSRAGFQRVGRREGYYPRADGGRAAALVMRADLG